MAKVPQPRKPGQTGGGGRIGQTSNRNKSSNRGGRPPGSGCAVTAFIILAAPVGAVYGLVELFF
jgi:hypothetical protein